MAVMTAQEAKNYLELKTRRELTVSGIFGDHL